MLCMKFSARISFFLCLIARVMITTKADEDLESYYCPNTTTFSPNTTYQTNLNELLSSLSSNSHRDNGFYNTTSGVTDPAANTVYGAFLCRGDLTADECGDCVSTAAKEVLQLCPVEKDTVIWYENCMLRYADRSFFSTIEQYPTRVTVNMYNVPESERNRFTQELRDTMKATATEASNGGADKKFATREANFPGFQNLYTLAQCTPDLSVVDCDHCLAEAIAKLPDGRPGVRINNPSCRIRYEIFQFYNQPAVPTPEQPGPKGRQKGQDSRTIVVVVVVSVVVAGILFCFAYRFLWTKMKKSYKAVLQENFGTESTALESLQFSLATIEAATNKFSHENKIGKGGFGEVYKGILFDGRQVAIKRLSRSSGQGAVEFKNEILVIAKLQHRNLVTLLGFCLEGEEKILVYEYVPNNSLDYFLFGTQKRSVLNWSECYQIIGGIAQGILYLHKYSRLKIIHRDLKPSNILLDDNMNPKISDFGMAKIVGIDEDQGSTNRVVGTFGYMSPEYTILGQYSEKSDVFSFGVIVMEIISGKKNASRYDSQYVDGLLSYVWKQWRDEKWLEILDPNLSTEVGLQSEVIKCIQIGLLCVQENPDARPSMVTVVSYLTNDSIQLPFPQEPAFFMHGRMEPPIIGEKKSGATSNFKPCSVNEMSMSIFCPR